MSNEHRDEGLRIEQEPWELPERYRLTDENLAAIKLQEKAWASRSISPFANVSPEEFERARSVKICEDLRFTLQRLDHAMRRARTAGQDGASKLPALTADRNAVRHQLAERYAVIGRYDLAVQVEPEQPYRMHYLQILDAVWREDAQQCACGDHRSQGAKPKSFTQLVAAQEVWSVKHGGVRPLLVCNECGFMNVADMPAELLRQRDLRARALQLVQHLSPVEARETLRKAGHTAEKLL